MLEETQNQAEYTEADQELLLRMSQRAGSAEMRDAFARLKDELSEDVRQKIYKTYVEPWEWRQRGYEL